MKITFTPFILSIVCLMSCDKEKEPIPVVENKNLVGDMAGHYEYFLQDVYTETRINWDIYKLSDSTIALKSVVGVNGYPGLPTIRGDSIPYIELSEANKIAFTHQNTDPRQNLRPGGYLLTGTAEMQGREIAINLNYSYAEEGNIKHKVKLQKK